MILESKAVSQSILDDARTQAQQLTAAGTPPVLAIIRAGSDPGSVSYEKSIVRRMADCNIEVKSIVLPQDVDEKTFIEHLDALNAASEVSAILLFKPLPEQIDEEKIKYLIHPQKDPDALNPVNLGKLMINDTTGFFPCTAEGVMELLDYCEIDVKGKNVVIVNNSDVLGKPLALMLTNRFATVTLCHVYTKDLASYTKNADIIISGAGVYGLITPEMLNDDAILIDVAMAQKKDTDGNFVLTEDGKKIRTGDAHEDCAQKAKMITSATPGCGGGTGPVTTALLAKNVVKAARQQREKHL